MTTIKIRNKDKFFASLKATVPAIDKEIRDALAKSGQEMVDKAKSFAPVEEGELRDSIKWEYTEKTQKDQTRSPAIVVTAGAEYKGDDAFYASFIEHGTVKMIRRPFFFPAYRLLRKKIRGRLTRSMTKAIKAAGFK